MLRGFMSEGGTRMRAVDLGESADIGGGIADVRAPERQVPPHAHGVMPGPKAGFQAYCWRLQTSSCGKHGEAAPLGLNFTCHWTLPALAVSGLVSG